MNLIGNAVKFTAHGEVLVKASVHSSGPDFEIVHIQVTDTGIGIETTATERIFEPFTQADESTTRRYGGSGLGLAICRDLAERMGGGITVDSIPNVGSTFLVTLPMQTAVATRPQVSAALRRRVGVLTDRAALQEALHRQISILGYEAVDANHEHATSPVDITVADFNTHRPFVEASLATGIATRAPLVVLAASAEVESLQTAYPLDSEVFVHKPVHREKLLDALRAAAARRPLRDLPALRAQSAERINAHVLLVEDEAINALVAQGYLAELGCTSVWVVSGAEAVARQMTERFDLVMMDLNMPNLDGFATARLIRQGEDPATHRTPIIALTAHDARQYRERCLQAGMDDVLSKPFTFQECVQLLHRWIKPATLSRTDLPVDVSQDVDLASLSVVDGSTVAGLRQLRGDRSQNLYSKLVDLFLGSSTDSLAQLKVLVTEKDWHSAGALSHKLAAAAANVGAVAFGREIRRLERACEAADAELVNHIYARIEFAHSALSESLGAHRMQASA
jgi:two-component system, sensor histidine kinase and response regulator